MIVVAMFLVAIAFTISTTRRITRDESKHALRQLRADLRIERETAERWKAIALSTHENNANLMDLVDRQRMFLRRYARGARDAPAEHN